VDICLFRSRALAGRGVLAGRLLARARSVVQRAERRGSVRCHRRGDVKKDPSARLVAVAGARSQSSLVVHSAEHVRDDSSHISGPGVRNGTVGRVVRSHFHLFGRWCCESAPRRMRGFNTSIQRQNKPRLHKHWQTVKEIARQGAPSGCVKWRTTDKDCGPRMRIPLEREVRALDGVDWFGPQSAPSITVSLRWSAGTSRGAPKTRGAHAERCGVAFRSTREVARSLYGAVGSCGAPGERVVRKWLLPPTKSQAARVARSAQNFVFWLVRSAAVQRC
jgi:hypothetical protein